MEEGNQQITHVLTKNERKKLLRKEIKKRIEEMYNSGNKRLIQPYLNMEETREQLLKRRERVKEEKEKRRDSLRSIGSIIYNAEEIHRKHTDSIVFSNGIQLSKLFSLVLKFLFSVKFSV
jgi:hypothetical protein